MPVQRRWLGQRSNAAVSDPGNVDRLVEESREAATALMVRQSQVQALAELWTSGDVTGGGGSAL